ncbi:hypothetical protein NQ317_000169 [Molorchus minor]|uniref:Pentraxin (PTX) domain-containing protein n=1 Tax=Molorchus minor TaxID=1323400 RepID=A0ABQ9JBT8_9CUCU|nr:hypothetical protein NQ317_000169 [Molorchus minor]
MRKTRGTSNMYRYLGLCLVVASAAGIHEPDSWHPFQQTDIFQGVKPVSLHGFLHQQQPESVLHGAAGDQCEIHKVGFTQDLYFQYIQYKTHIPDLKQFTLCYWAKFYNHSNDHPIFSYAVDGQPKAIQSWVSNTDRSSYFSLAVEGHTFYRLNYPLRLNKWYHTCQSWNGKTGEWQIWVNAERVGRGFHNRLVGDTIQGGGIAITGQEQSQLGGGFQEGHEAPKGSGGMLGEVTMIQLYSVALTAGKAHKDHKHHHAHQYDHSGKMITTPAPTTPRNRPTQASHPLLTAGQINRKVKINFANGQPGQDINVQFVNGQIVNNLVSRQLTRAQGTGPNTFLIQPQQPVQSQQFSFLPPAGRGSTSSQFLSLGNGQIVNSDLNHEIQPVRFVDNSQSILDTHNLFKRHNEEKTSDSVQDNSEATKEKAVEKRETESNESKQKKRDLYLAGGTIIEEPLTHGSSNGLEHALLYGLAGIGQNHVVSEQQKQEEDEREPAEAEVNAVLHVCSGCDPEPFDKALVFGWRTVPKKLYSGAFYSLAVPQCKGF